jgi:hypothetical protein
MPLGRLLFNTLSKLICIFFGGIPPLQVPALLIEPIHPLPNCIGGVIINMLASSVVYLVSSSGWFKPKTTKLLSGVNTPTREQ